MNIEEVKGLFSRKHDRIILTKYDIPQHREDDLKICVALQLLVAILERFAETRENIEKEKSGTTWTKLGVQELFLDFIEKGVRHPCDAGPVAERKENVNETKENMNETKQFESRLEEVARQVIKEYHPTYKNPEEMTQRLLKDHQVRCAHSTLKDDLNQPNVHYLEPENRTALEWAYLHLSEAELLHERCRRVLVANTLHILQREESGLVEKPTKKRFRVTYDVKRAGSQDMVVEAENEAEARNLVQSLLNKSGTSSFDKVKTEFVAAEVYEANEEKGAEK